MKTNYVLIDYENVQVKSLALLKAEHFRVKLFLGPKNTKLPVELVLAMQELGCRAEYIVLEASGNNALDFHVAYYLGVLTSEDPSGFFHVISRDTGFDPLVQHLRSQKISLVRSVSMEEMPCFSKTAAIISDDGKAVHEKTANESCPLDELARLVVNDLARRGNSKPGRPETLRSTVHATCGKNLPDAEIDAVLDALAKRGYVGTNGEKVAYSLPNPPL